MKFIINPIQSISTFVSILFNIRIHPLKLVSILLHSYTSWFDIRIYVLQHLNQRPISTFVSILKHLYKMLRVLPLPRPTNCQSLRRQPTEIIYLDLQNSSHTSDAFNWARRSVKSAVKLEENLSPPRTPDLCTSTRAHLLLISPFSKCETVN